MAQRHSTPLLCAICLSISTVYAADKASFSQGRGTVVVAKLHECAGGRPTPVGTVKSNDGKTWTVPADNQFQTGVKAADLYNPCNPSSRAICRPWI